MNSVGHLIEKIDALYRTYSAINTTELGAIGEIFAAAAAIATTGKIDNVTTDIIDKAIIGKMGSFTNMNITSNISTEFTSKDMIGMSITYDKNGKIYQAPKSQDTVDIQVDLGNSDNIFATNQLRASIKNYNNIYSPHGISIISGTNLLALLQLFDSSFGNHYLNRNVFYDKYSSDLDSLDELLKYGLAARALSGMRTMGFEKLSQYLIIYSRRQNRFFVYSTNTILDNLYHPGKGFNNTMVEVDGFDFRQKLKQNNEYIGSKNNPSSELAYQRISKVLAAARQSKLSMSLKFNK